MDPGSLSTSLVAIYRPHPPKSFLTLKNLHAWTKRHEGGGLTSHRPNLGVKQVRRTRRTISLGNESRKVLPSESRYASGFPKRIQYYS